MLILCICFNGRRRDMGPQANAQAMGDLVHSLCFTCALPGIAARRDLYTHAHVCGMFSWARSMVNAQCHSRTLCHENSGGPVATSPKGALGQQMVQCVFNGAGTSEARNTHRGVEPRVSCTDANLKCSGSDHQRHIQ